MDLSSLPEPRKPMTGPQSGVFASTLGGGTSGIPASASLALTYLPVSEDGLIRVRCEGPLSLRGKPYGFDPLRELLGPRAHSQTVLLSLEKVVGAETSGVSWLFQCGEKFAAHAGRLVLYAVPPQVSSLIDMLQLQAPFAIASSEAEAKKLAVSTPATPT